ncbi:ABC transporter permease [Microbacterium sp. Root322]|uniref:ABC transporter permease n=1 Tax=unclassified Microbacterium TaxID=2609290 RepID=UPI0006F61115|nr:ABC transporter permease subunit [Microbacterium sp. Root322]KQV02727.1 ABC transporter permease [Microbacterium sp. Root322]
MSVVSATGTVRIVRPRRVVRSGEGKWTLLLIGVVAAVLLLWEAAVSWFGWVPAVFLPPPSAVAVAFGQLMVDAEFWSAFAFSVTNLLIGLAIAIVVGVVVGLAVGWSPVLRFMVAPFLWVLYSTPKVALAPLFILGLGLGSESKIALVILLAVFPILLNTMEGAVTVNPSLVNAARVYGAKGIGLGWKVIFPATLPYSLSGIQRGAALGFTGEVLGEFLGGTGGLGHLLEFAAYQFRMDEAIAMVVVMVIIANLTLLLISILRRRLAPWYDERKIVG